MYLEVSLAPTYAMIRSYTGSVVLLALFVLVTYTSLFHLLRRSQRQAKVLQAVEQTLREHRDQLVHHVEEQTYYLVEARDAAESAQKMLQLVLDTIPVLQTELAPSQRHYLEKIAKSAWHPQRLGWRASQASAAAFISLLASANARASPHRACPESAGAGWEDRQLLMSCAKRRSCR